MINEIRFIHYKFSHMKAQVHPGDWYRGSSPIRNRAPPRTRHRATVGT